ncbi:hypothetical protein OA251_03855 [Prochlorococcus sp. AH-716-P08]|nr:hypothetical protein [Prochlorococcus sp. AH-716-P08]
MKKNLDENSYEKRIENIEKGKSYLKSRMGQFSITKLIPIILQQRIRTQTNLLGQSS